MRFSDKKVTTLEHDSAVAVWPAGAPPRGVACLSSRRQPTIAARTKSTSITIIITVPPALPLSYFLSLHIQATLFAVIFSNARSFVPEFRAPRVVDQPERTRRSVLLVPGRMPSPPAVVFLSNLPATAITPWSNYLAARLCRVFVQRHYINWLEKRVPHTSIVNLQFREVIDLVTITKNANSVPCSFPLGLRYEWSWKKWFHELLHFTFYVFNNNSVLYHINYDSLLLFVVYFLKWSFTRRGITVHPNKEIVTVFIVAYTQRNTVFVIPHPSALPEEQT